MKARWVCFGVCTFLGVVHLQDSTGQSPTLRLDPLSKCAKPQSRPAVSRVQAAPEGDQQRAELRTYHSCVEAVRSEQETARRKIRTRTVLALDEGATSYVVSKIDKWNGPIFWAPASKSTNLITRAGDEVRSVFGPIPEVDCRDGRAAIIPTQVDGNIVRMKRNTSKPANPLEFEHLDVNGQLVKWTTTLPKCDKPSLAGGVAFCGLASRLGRVQRGNVEWIILCRKSKGEEVKLDEYWQEDNPEYALIGHIGYNRNSGEVAFFDGNPNLTFNWKNTIVSPGGKGYNDDEGRRAAEAIYDATFNIRCEQCHDNKEPRIVTPYIKQARVGFRDAQRAARFSMDKEVLPEDTRGRTDPYRIIGSGFTTASMAAGNELIEGRAIRDPAGNCTGCHTLTTLNTGTKFTYDAVGKLAGVEKESAHRTEWATRKGAGKIHPWMLPTGNDIGEPPRPELSEAEWKMLEECIRGRGGEACDAKRLFNSCPAPESSADENTRISDLSGPGNLQAIAKANRDQDSALFRKEIAITWKYRNSLGGVPERDDVRYLMAIRETDLRMGGADTVPSDFPTIAQTVAVDEADPPVPVVAGEIYRNGDVLILRDISYVGHAKWTDPRPTNAARDYRVVVPAQCGKRYFVRIVAKRFCFDQTGKNYSRVDHTVSVDVNC